MSVDTLLLVDTETGGLDPAKDPLLEVGAVLWSVKHGCSISCWSTLIQGASNEAAHVNHIPPKALEEAVTDRHQAITVLQRLASRADVVVAHNAEFDKGFLPEIHRPWVCSKFDVKWPNVEIDGESLVKICVQNGVAVAAAHRALTDCLLLARLFERMIEMGESVPEMLQRAMRPKADFLSLAPFEQKDIVKAAGFKWKPETKQWIRRMAIDDAAALPFKVRQM